MINIITSFYCLIIIIFIILYYTDIFKIINLTPFIGNLKILDNKSLYQFDIENINKISIKLLIYFILIILLHIIYTKKEDEDMIKDAIYMVKFIIIIEMIYTLLNIVLKSIQNYIESKDNFKKWHNNLLNYIPILIIIIYIILKIIFY